MRIKTIDDEPIERDIESFACIDSVPIKQKHLLITKSKERSQNYRLGRAAEIGSDQGLGFRLILCF